jgi:hypothetical protein
MAITQIEYALLSGLRTAGLLPPKPRVLELGKNNWFGDIPLEQLAQDIYQFCDDAEERRQLLKRLDAMSPKERPEDLFEIAEIALRVLLDCSTLTAIDLYQPTRARAWDLNHPLPTADEFDVIVDSGTSACVFNTAQFFRTAHERTAVGGVMLHGVPLSGWIDHAFYSFHPGLMWDLAAANGYDVLAMLYGEINPMRVVQWQGRHDGVAMARQGQIAANSCLYAVFRKRTASDFRLPAMSAYESSQKKAA